MNSKRDRFRDLFADRRARVIAAAMLVATASGCQEGNLLSGDPFRLGEGVSLPGQVSDTDSAAIGALVNAAPQVMTPTAFASRKPSLPSATRPVAGADKAPADDPDLVRGDAPPEVLKKVRLLDRQMVEPDLADSNVAGPGRIEPVVDAPETSEDDAILGGAEPGERLDALLASGRHEDAAGLVLDNKTYFRRHWLAYKDKISRIAAALNATREPALFEAMGSLAHIRWPAPQDAWPAMRHALQNAQSVLDAYLEHPFLRDPPYRSSFADDLSRRMERSRERIARFASEKFVLYDHLSGPSFIEVWPLELDAPRFMADNFEHVQGALAVMSHADLDRFLARYPVGEVLTGATLSKFSDLYLAALVAEQPSSAADTPTRLRDHLRAWQAARDRGLTPTGFGGVRIAVALRSPIAESDGTPSALRIDGDVGEIDDPKDADYVILLEPGPARAARNVITSERVPSLYLGPPEEGGADWHPTAGYFEAMASAEVGESADTPRMETSGKNPLQFLASFFGGGDFEAAGGAAPGEEGTVPSHPATLATVADYHDYVYIREEIEADKILTINATLIDRASGAETPSAFDVTFRRRFVRAKGVRANDPGRAAHLADTDDDQAVADWEARPVTVPVSLVLGYFAAAKR